MFCKVEDGPAVTAGDFIGPKLTWNGGVRLCRFGNSSGPHRDILWFVIGQHTEIDIPPA